MGTGSPCRFSPTAEVRQIPIADGGEGTVQALVSATAGQLRMCEVSDPLGEKITAVWGVLGDGQTAVIEMAAASGLTLLPASRRDPRITSTYGTGELIRAALDAGLRKIIIGIGGSATNDGGTGMARALGVRFTNAQGVELPAGGAALAQLRHIDLTGLDARLLETEITVAACDVDNPLCGARGASAVFGPQKGATPRQSSPNSMLHSQHFAAHAQAATGRQVAETRGRRSRWRPWRRAAVLHSGETQPRHRHRPRRGQFCRGRQRRGFRADRRGPHRFSDRFWQGPSRCRANRQTVPGAGILPVGAVWVRTPTRSWPRESMPFSASATDRCGSKNACTTVAR
jgi:hypothetical protein